MLDNGFSPPGSYLAEQSGAAARQFLILSGEPEMRQESNRGCRKLLRRIGAGGFLGGAPATAIEYAPAAALSLAEA